MLSALQYPSHSGVYTLIPVVVGAYLTYAGFFQLNAVDP
jgi:hypothetical protein